MVYVEDSATNALRSYLWKLLESNLGWSKDDYNGVVPIIPIAQEPELKDTGRPFVVYNSSQHEANHLYVLKSEEVGLYIYAPTVGEANRIAKLIADTFDRQDEAADDVNSWLNTEQAGRNKNRNIAFTSIKTDLIDRADATDNEGGYVAALVLLEAKYLTENNTIVTTGFTYP